jgi:hypothetical protein
MGNIARVSSGHEGIFGQYSIAFVRDLHRPVAPRISSCNVRPHGLGMADDSSKVFDNNTDVKTFLDIEFLKVFPLERH